MRSVLLCVLAAGCSGVFSDTSTTVEGHVLDVYDERLPDAIETVFQSCVGTLSLYENDTTLGVLPCAFRGSTPAAVVFGALEQRNQLLAPINLTFTRSGLVTDAMPGCAITFNPRYEVDGLDLTGLQADWVQFADGPGLRLDLDPRAGWGAFVTPNGVAVCDNIVSQLAADANLNLINNRHAVDFDQPNISFDVVFDASSSWEPRVDEHVDLNLLTNHQRLQVPPAWLDVITMGDTNIYDPAPLEFLLESMLRTAMNGPRPSSLVTPPSGPEADLRDAFWSTEICSVSVDGGELELVTDEDCFFDYGWTYPSGR